MNKQFSYFLFHLWFVSIIKIYLFIFFLIAIFIINKQPFGFIIGALIFIVFYKNILNTIRNLYRSITNKPAIEITDEYFINHMNNTKIHWKNIKKISLSGGGLTQAIRFDLKNRKNYIEQVKNPFDKFFYILAPDVANIQFALMFIEGNNHKTYEEIKDFFIKKITIIN